MSAPLWETAVADFALREDRKYYTVEKENSTITSEMEGGYTASRPRFLRAPRRTFTTGFTDLSVANKAALEAFWDSVRGGAAAFYWMNKFERESYAFENNVDVSTVSTTGYRVLVRFDPKQSLTFQQKGIGQLLRYDCPNIKMQEV